MVLLSSWLLEEKNVVSLRADKPSADLGSDSSPFTQSAVPSSQTGIVCCTLWYNAPEWESDQGTLRVCSSQSCISANDNC